MAYRTPLTILCTVLAFFLSNDCALQAQIQMDTLVNQNFKNISAIDFISDAVGIVTDDSLVHFTMDEGATWNHRHIPDMVPGGVAVSIHGNDTLFVIAEGKYQRVRYFHGFQGQYVDLYLDSNETQNWFPSVAKNGENILIAGGFVDSVGESFLLRSQDHGMTWHRVYSDRVPGRMVAVEHRQLDTFLINFNPINQPFERGKSYYFYDNGNLTGLSWPALRGVRNNCYGNTCLGYEEQDVFIHRGPIIYAASNGLNSYDFNYEDENVRLVLNAPDEFVYVIGDKDSVGAFKIVMHQFSLTKSLTSLSMYLTPTDTAEYTFFESQAISHIPGGICRSTNYIYFTIAPKIYRIKSSSIGLNFYKPLNQINGAVGYDPVNQQLYVFGLEESKEYSGIIYNLAGKHIWSGYLSAQKNDLPFSSYPEGIYFLNLRSAEGTNGTIKFIKY